MGLSSSVRGQQRQAARVDGEILRSLAQAAAVVSLTEIELELHKRPVTRLPLAEPVFAWIRYGDRATRVEAEIVAHTDRAAAVRWVVPGVGVDRAWVWLSAVESRG